MDKKLIGIICAIISMCSVVVFFIWGWVANSFAHAWLIFMIAGIACATTSMIGNYLNDKKSKESKESKKSDKK